MANNPGDGPADDFLEQILGFPAYAGADANLAGNEAAAAAPPMMLQLNSGEGSGHLGGAAGAGGGFHFPLGLSLDQGKGGRFLKMDEVASGSGKRFREDVDCRVSSTVNTLPALPFYYLQPNRSTISARLLLPLFPSEINRHNRRGNGRKQNHAGPRRCRFVLHSRTQSITQVNVGPRRCRVYKSIATYR